MDFLVLIIILLLLAGISYLVFNKILDKETKSRVGFLLKILLAIFVLLLLLAVFMNTNR